MMEQLAIDHKDILHGIEVSPGQGQGYAEIWISSDPYSKIDYSGFLNKIKSQIKYPMMINMGVTFDDKSTQGTSRSADAKFVILTKSSPQKDNKACYAETEAIARDIVERLRNYFEFNVKYGYMEDKTTTEAVGPVSVDGKLYGVTVNFDYTARVGCSYDESKWETTIEEISE